MSFLWCLLLAGTAYAVPRYIPWDSEWGESRTPLSYTETRREDTCSCGWANRGRIVGGKETLKNEFPFMVSLQRRNFPICGGSIVTPWHVLTAAHCTHGKSASSLQVVVGAHDLTSYNDARYDVAKYYMHEKFSIRYYTEDVALLVTSRKIIFSHNVGPVCLPTRRLDLVGETLKAIGWGRTSADVPSSKGPLRQVDLKVVNFDSCLRDWEAAPISIKEEPEANPVRSMNMCTFAYRQDTCAGDSGGPLLWLNPSSNRYTIAALVSYGGICGGRLPAVNTDVTAYVDWINDKIEDSGKGVQGCSKA